MTLVNSQVRPLVTLTHGYLKDDIFAKGFLGVFRDFIQSFFFKFNQPFLEWNSFLNFCQFFLSSFLKDSDSDLCWSFKEVINESGNVHSVSLSAAHSHFRSSSFFKLSSCKKCCNLLVHTDHTNTRMTWPLVCCKSAFLCMETQPGIELPFKFCFVY